MVQLSLSQPTRGAMLCLSLLGSSACAEGRASADAAVVRDSAGIAITESATPAWSEGEALTLAAEPAVVIGREDDPDYQFGRISAATRLSDGRIAVFDGMANELRFFDAQGRFMRKTGGSGGGPGEYKRVIWMQRLKGDSLMLYDLSARRITVLGPDSALARSASLTHRAIASFADGTLLASARLGAAPHIGGPAMRESQVYLRLAADGTPLDTVGTFIGDERQIQQSGSGSNMSIVIGPPPFGKNSQVAVDGDGFWFGSADRYELARYTADGRLVRLVRRSVEPLPVTPEDVEAQKPNELDRSTPGTPPEAAARLRRMAEERWANATLPSTLPAHGELQVDPAGRLWVHEITRPADAIPRWSAFDADGRLLGTIAMPADFRVLEIGRDYVLGVKRGENDVEQIWLHTLRSGGTGRA